MTLMKACLIAQTQWHDQPDVTNILERVLILQNVAILVAGLAGNPPAKNTMLPSNVIVKALAASDPNIIRQFAQQCETINDFLRLGLSALQTARANGTFNAQAAHRLHEEYTVSQTKALAMIGI